MRDPRHEIQDKFIEEYISNSFFDWYGMQIELLGETEQGQLVTSTRWQIPTRPDMIRKIVFVGETVLSDNCIDDSQLE